MAGVGAATLDSGEGLNLAAVFDGFEAAAGLLLNGGRANTSPFGQVTLDFAQAFAELADRPLGVALLVVVETHGEVNEALQKPALGLARGGPHFFEHLVAFEEFPSVE